MAGSVWWPGLRARQAERRLYELMMDGIVGKGVRRPACIAVQPRTERVTVVRSADGRVFGHADVPVDLAWTPVGEHGN